MPDRPNIIFINVDQMRYDCMSCAVHPVVETPHLDYLAHRGVRFTRAFSAVPSCIAARAAIHTGLSQRTHGRVGYQDAVTWNYPVTLAGELTRAGYQTQAVGKMHAHPQRWAGGFENVMLHDGYLHYYGLDRQDDYAAWLAGQIGTEVGYFDHGLGCNSWVARPWHLAEHLHPTNWVVSRSLDFLRGRDERRPFFLYLSFVRPHAPLDPPQAYWDQYIGQTMPPPPVGDWADRIRFDGDGTWNPSAFQARLDERALHRARAGYYALITHLDHQLSRLHEHMGDMRLLDNTVFVFASDHGEMMGDHNLFRKALGYAGSAAVPLFVSLPGLDGRGATAGEVVELRDIMPTLLDAAGAAIPEGVEGRSLLPLVRQACAAGAGGPAAAAGRLVDWREYLHGEHAFGANSNHYIVDGRWKYIWYSQSGMEQLFDNQQDPQELRDLAARLEFAGELSRLRACLVRELTGREEGYTDGRSLIPGRRPTHSLSHIL